MARQHWATYIVTSLGTRAVTGAIIYLLVTDVSVQRAEGADIDSGNTRLASNLGNGVNQNVLILPGINDRMTFILPDRVQQ
jgi:hypothetical protein